MEFEESALNKTAALSTLVQYTMFIFLTACLLIPRDVVSQPISASVGCGFHGQNPSDSEADADLSRDQNYQLLWLLEFNLVT